MKGSFIKRITWFLAYCGFLAHLPGNSYPENIEGKYCQPDCDKPVSYLTFNSDSTFSFRTMLYGGISRSGTWDLIKENKIQINTNKIVSQNNPYQMPPPQIITILSNETLELGNILYTR